MNNRNLGTKDIIGTAVVKDDNGVWISACNYNALYYYSFHSQKTEFIALFPDEPLGKWKLHCGAIKYEKKIVFIPDRSDYIHIFDTEKRIFWSHPIDLAGRGGAFFEGIIDKKCIFVRYAQNAYIVSFNLETLEINKNSICDAIYEKEVLVNTIIEYDKWFITADKTKDVIYYINKNDLKIEKKEIKAENKGFGTIILVDKDLWISAVRKLYRYDIQSDTVEEVLIPEEYMEMTVKENGHVKKYNTFKEELLEYEKPYSFCMILNGKIRFMPFRVDKIIDLDLEQKPPIVVLPNIENEIEDENSLNNPERLSHCHYLINGNEGYTSTISGKYYCLDNNGKQVGVTFKVNNIYRDAISNRSIKKIYEAEDCNIKDYVEIIKILKR